jgi:diguanylate cyclase (GGDEF)-like protein
MFRVVACVFEEHNLWLVLLAACVCVAAAIGVFFVLDSAKLSAAKERRRWLMLAGVLAGGGTWTTHFVAMLGYSPGLPIGFDLGLTLLSAAVCMLGAWVAFEIHDRIDTNGGRIGSGVILGLSIGLMHFTGMASVEAAARETWAVDLIVASWLFSISLSIVAIQVFCFAPARLRVLASAGTLVLAIVALHFTAMGALTLIPDPTMAAPSGNLDPHLLGITIATVTAAALTVGVVLALADRRVNALELAQARQAAAMALHDALTGLPNRRHLLASLERLLTERESEERLAVIAIDLDRFKPVNDLYGHAVGDELLVRIAKLLSEEAGADGFVARLGGDEFVMVLPCARAEDLIGRLSALVSGFEAPIALGEHEVSVGATLGVAMGPDDGEDAPLLLRRADAALYRAKEDGRGRFAFFEPGLDARALERAMLEHDLRQAVRNDEIVPFFQPLVDLDTGAVKAFEILSRWPHPTRGMIGPDQFIKIAEETGLIGEMTFNILRQACREALHWPGAPRLSLNIAPAQLHDAALPQKILKVLAECGFPPGRLEIEITEDALVADFEAARALLSSLKNLDVRIALDDFGTGYSSLRHLRELPFDVLKIDRSFVHSMTDSEEAMSIVRTIVHLAKSLGLSVTAEGIETQGQAAELQALGCERGQGFLLGKPSAHPQQAAIAGEDETAKPARRTA